MIDTIYFLICLAGLMFTCIWGGWYKGYKDGKAELERIYLVINGEEHRVK